MRRVAQALVAVLVVSYLAATSAVPAAAGDPTPDPVGQPAYRPPVDAPIAGHFRPPTTTYGPGNFGLDYSTRPGTPVVASAGGVVEFAGQVGGQFHVVVRHADGLRTSYSFLQTIVVSKGQTVRQGDVLGTSGTLFHFGVRAGDQYLDPELLLAGRLFSVELVPAEGKTQAQRRLEDMIWAARFGDGDSPLEGLGHLAGGLLGAVADGGVVVVDAGGHVLATVSPAVWAWASRALDPAHLVALFRANFSEFLLLPAWVQLGFVMGEGVFAWAAQRDDCTKKADARAVPPSGIENHVAILVAGIGSTSEGTDGIDHVDLAAIGYRPGNVARFSYAGGRIPSMQPGAAFAGVPVTTYDGDDSQQSIDVSAARLLEMLRRVHRDDPTAPIDLLAHSQGGIVAVRALQMWAIAGDLPAGVVHLVTIASPHRGDTLATALDTAMENPFAALAVGGVEASGLTGSLRADSPSAQQLSKASPFMADYQFKGLPAGVVGVSIGGRNDVVVALDDTHLSGARHVGVAECSGFLCSDTHHTLPADPAVTDVIRLSVRGMAPPCRELVSFLADGAVSFGVTQLETGLGVLVSG